MPLGWETNTKYTVESESLRGELGMGNPRAPHPLYESSNTACMCTITCFCLHSCLLTHTHIMHTYTHTFTYRLSYSSGSTRPPWRRRRMPRTTDSGSKRTPRYVLYALCWYRAFKFVDPVPFLRIPNSKVQPQLSGSHLSGTSIIQTSWTPQNTLPRMRKRRGQ